MVCRDKIARQCQDSVGMVSCMVSRPWFRTGEAIWEVGALVSAVDVEVSGAFRTHADRSTCLHVLEIQTEWLNMLQLSEEQLLRRQGVPPGFRIRPGRSDRKQPRTGGMLPGRSLQRAGPVRVCNVCRQLTIRLAANSSNCQISERTNARVCTTHTENREQPG